MTKKIRKKIFAISATKKIKTIFFIVFFLFLAIFAGWEILAEEEIEINFIRRHKEQSKYYAEIKGEYTVLCELFSENSKREIKNAKSIEFKGLIEIEECDENQMPVKITLKAEKIQGMVLEDNSFFQKGFRDFSISWDGEIMKVESNNPEFKASQQERELLSIIFRPPTKSSKLEVLFGEKIILQQESQTNWQPPKEQIKKIFREKNLIIDDNNIEIIATYKGKNKLHNLDCAELEAKISISGIENFGFEYIAEILLPLNSDSTPVKTRSKSIEKIRKTSPNIKANELIDPDIREIKITIIHLIESDLKPQQ